MDEQQTDRVPYKEDAPEEKKPVVAKQTDDVFEKASSFMDSTQYHKIAEFFDIAYEERRDSALFDKMNVIREWAAQQGKSSDPADILLEVDALRKKLGLQMKGKDLATRLHRYIRLSMDRDRLEKEMKLALV